MSDISFGTDGWRGRIADDYTFSNVRRCAQGFASWLIQTGNAEKRVVVGHDRRFLGEQFAAAVAEVLAGNGLTVLLTKGPTPTPVISYSVVANQAVAAVNITASHNPPADNGFKVRDATGGAVPPVGLQEIEDLIPNPKDGLAVQRMPLHQAVESDRIRYFDPKPDYLAHLATLIDVEPIKQAGLTVLVDNMWGNGAGWLSEILEGGSTRVIEFHAERNPIFPEMERPEPIPPNVDAGLAKAREVGADVVCIMDGDADRCGLGDENGNFIDQLRVYAMLAYYMLEVRSERGPIVKTISTTSMLNKLGKLYDVFIVETGVGFKYVAPAMVEHEAMIGGEESGGYAFRNHVPERDGILANLYLLDALVQTGKKPSQLLAEVFDKVGAHYYGRIDTRLTGNDMKEEARARLNDVDINGLTLGGKQVTDLVRVDGYKFQMEDGGWLLVRFSGTEPLIRVYTETTDEDAVDAILADGKRVAGID